MSIFKRLFFRRRVNRELDAIREEISRLRHLLHCANEDVAELKDKLRKALS